MSELLLNFQVNCVVETQLEAFSSIELIKHSCSESQVSSSLFFFVHFIIRHLSWVESRAPNLLVALTVNQPDIWNDINRAPELLDCEFAKWTPENSLPKKYLYNHFIQDVTDFQLYIIQSLRKRNNKMSVCLKCFQNHFRTTWTFRKMNHFKPNYSKINLKMAQCTVWTKTGIWWGPLSRVLRVWPV